MRVRQQLLLTPPTNVWISKVIYQISSVSQDLEWTVDEQVNTGRTPDVYTSQELLQEQDEPSGFEKSMIELLKEGLVTSDYVQDVFQQEQLFKDNFERVKKEFPNKDIAVCGGEIFVGDTLKDAEKKAHDKYKNRPTYSYSPTIEI